MITVPVTNTRAQLSRLLAEVEKLGDPVTITRRGRPVAVLLAVGVYGGLLETLDILVDAKLMASIRRGLRDAEKGRVLADDEVWR